eukprot:TRINITY_DN2784_c0_g1::TRINITY_DN2784_c0_g1_i1::g.27494::m.27494 TRINITY_DN2784_c0_g1::TRINITY_DN2784_c0_g1_i1::g.27494  ORF type:complete len:227 (-),score=5.31,F-box/PF00646.28/2.3e-07,F-box-like/PF12937.2/1.3e-06 TRINITY_DN2784_c0_g1_i1:240-920(-)
MFQPAGQNDVAHALLQLSTSDNDPDFRLTDFPTDLLVHIFALLNPCDLLTLRQVCCRFRSLQTQIMEEMRHRGNHSLTVRIMRQNQPFIDVRTIQQALRRSKPGDVILARAKEYHEKLVICHEVTILGEPSSFGSDSPGCVISGRVQVSDARFSAAHLTFKLHDIGPIPPPRILYAIDLRPDQPWMLFLRRSNVSLRNCLIQGVRAPGIMSDRESPLHIQECKFQD